jgi:hypothetical protein
LKLKLILKLILKLKRGRQADAYCPLIVCRYDTTEILVIPVIGA